MPAPAYRETHRGYMNLLFVVGMYCIVPNLHLASTVQYSTVLYIEVILSAQLFIR